MHSRSLLRPILPAGLLAGTLDGLAAAASYSLQTGKNPANVFKFVASGAFGPEALTGPDTVAVWGLLFHFLFATGFVTLFVLAYPKVEILRKNWIVVGLTYGVFVWLVMNGVVVPLSNTPPAPFRPIGMVRGLVIVMVCVGLPIAWVTNRFYGWAALHRRG